jgi:DNA-binding NarL/FixJ family response regulator
VGEWLPEPVPDGAMWTGATSATMRELRSTVRLLRSADADVERGAVGLAGLSGVIDRAREAGIDVDVDVDAAAVLDTAIDAAAYRIVQESLTNVIRHAEARHAWVQVRVAGEQVEVQVRDDGKGTDSPVPHRDGAGLAGMRERVTLLGGQLVAGADPRGGFVVRAAAGEAADMIRIVLVDDQEVVRAGLRTLAEHDGDIAVVAEAGTGRGGRDRVRELRPDVVLMDIRMPHMDGLEATRHIVADPALTDVKVLVLTTFDEDELVVEAIRAGASGYLLKDVSPADLRQAIRRVAAGEPMLGPSATRAVMRTVAAGRPAAVDDAALRGLTEREREVLALVGRGLSNDEIARELFVSPATARTYVSRLLTKLDARDRARLIVLAYQTGLVAPGS